MLVVGHLITAVVVSSDDLRLGPTVRTGRLVGAGAAAAAGLPGRDPEMRTWDVTHDILWIRSTASTRNTGAEACGR